MNLVTLFLFIIYFIYLFLVISKKNSKRNLEKREKYIVLKFIISALLLIIFSICLTLIVDYMSKTYPGVSSSTFGAILLGVTTSLPEVVSTFMLIKIDNYDMAISNILGSNIFNLLVLSLSDIFIKKGNIYSYSDKYSLLYLFGCIFTSILLLVSILKKDKPKIFYIFLSVVMSLSYLVIWYFQFK